MAKRGRPRLTDEQAASEAARIINVAFALRYRPAQLARLGFESEVSAIRYVSKRYRGRTGEFVGDSVRELLFFREQTLELSNVNVPARSWEVQVAPGEKPRWGFALGRSVTTSLIGTNLTEIAAHLVLDLGVKPPDAARLTGVSPGNLHRAVKVERKRRQRPSTIKAVSIVDHPG